MGFTGEGFGFGNATTLGSGKIGIHYITDVAVIAVITADANWDANGEYTGSTASLSAGDRYIDSANHLLYEFDGTTLIRSIMDNYV